MNAWRRFLAHLAPTSATYPKPRLWISLIEPLEARIAPAYTLSLSNNVSAGVGEVISNGVATFTAVAHGANLNWVDVGNAVSSGFSVVITSGGGGSEDGNITDTAATTVVSPMAGESVTIQSGTGAGLKGNISLMNLNFSWSNATATIAAHGDLSVANLNSNVPALLSATLSSATGSITGTASNVINAASLQLSANTGIAGSGSALFTNASHLEATTTSGGIQISNSGALTLGGITSSPTAIGATSGGGINIKAGGAITVSANVTAPGAITLTATDAASTKTENITISGGATVSSSTGDVTLLAGDDINILSGSMVSATSGNLVLQSGAGDVDNEGTMTISGLLFAGDSGAIALTANSSNSALPNGVSAVTESATGRLTGGGLQLFEITTSTHPFSLTASATNHISTLAATSFSAIEFLNSADLAVGVARSPIGVTIGIATNGAPVSLAASAGSIILNSNVDVGNSSLLLTASGAVTQGANGKISALTLGISAGDNIELAKASPANFVQLIALASTGLNSFIHFQNDIGVDVVTAAASDLFPGVTGIHSNNGDIDLNAPVGLALSNAIDASPLAGGNSTATIRLDSGTITQSSQGDVAITCANLAIVANGLVQLDDPANHVTGVLAMHDSAILGAVTFVDSAGFTVGAIAQDTVCPGAQGVTTNLSAITLIAHSGKLSIEEMVNAGLGGIQSSPIDLECAGEIVVDAFVSSSSLVRLTTTDVAPSGQDILVHAAASIVSGTEVDLVSADNIVIDSGSMITAVSEPVSMQVGAGSMHQAGGAGGTWVSAGSISGSSVSVSGGLGNDIFFAPANGNVSHFDGGDGINTYITPRVAGDVTVTDAGVSTTAIGNATFAHIQVVNISGDNTVNHFDATGFHGFSVVSGGGGADVIKGASALVQPLSVSFKSTDGDQVTLQLTKGSLDATNFRFLPNAAFTGANLNALDLEGDQAFAGTKISFTAKHTRAGGDGFFDVGSIDATGVDLGAVSIPGDLGQIDAGHGSATGLALASLSVHSLGVRGLVNELPGGSLESDLVGRVGSVKIAGDIDVASLRVTGGATPALGSIARISVGGNLLGGDADYTGSITATGNIGPIAIKGGLFGAAGDYSGSIVTTNGGSIGKVSAGSLSAGHSSFEGIFSDGQLGAVKIKGGVTGSDVSRVTISAAGLPDPGPHVSAKAIAGVNIGGNLAFTDILAGYAPDRSAVNADVQIGSVTVGRDWLASNLIAGVLGDPDSGFGTANDSLIPGGNSTTSKIAAVLIKGQALGLDGSLETFGIEAQQLTSIRAGGHTAPLKAGADNDIALIPLGPTANFGAREV